MPILIIFCLFVRYFFLLKSTEVCLFYSSLSYSLFSVWEKFLLCCVYFRMSSFSLSNSVKPYFFQEKLKVGCLYLLLVDMPLICLLLMMWCGAPSWRTRPSGDYKLLWTLTHRHTHMQMILSNNQFIDQSCLDRVSDLRMYIKKW